MSKSGLWVPGVTDVPVVDPATLKGLDGHVHPLGRTEQFVCWWKKDKSNEMKELTYLGLFKYTADMQGKLEQWSRVDPRFMSRFAGGVFYGVDIRNTYRVDPGILAAHGLGGR